MPVNPSPLLCNYNFGKTLNTSSLYSCALEKNKIKNQSTLGRLYVAFFFFFCSSYSSFSKPTEMSDCRLYPINFSEPNFDWSADNRDTSARLFWGGKRTLPSRETRMEQRGWNSVPVPHNSNLFGESPGMPAAELCTPGESCTGLIGIRSAMLWIVPLLTKTRKKLTKTSMESFLTYTRRISHGCQCYKKDCGDEILF